MPKKRKTRKQKISIEQKRYTVQNTIESTESTQTIVAHTSQQNNTDQGVTFSLPNAIQAKNKVSIKPNTHTIKVITTSEYGYLANDLTRTALLCIAIVITEILIRLFYVH